jgi:hypothetical protein
LLPIIHKDKKAEQAKKLFIGTSSDKIIKKHKSEKLLFGKLAYPEPEGLVWGLCRLQKGCPPDDKWQNVCFKYSDRLIFPGLTY